MAFLRRALAQLSLVLLPASALAAGVEIPDNGALILARGGTGTTQFGTAYALQFNPAGMMWNTGLDVRVDARAVNHAVEFDRAGEAGKTFLTVSNDAGLYIAPYIGATYREQSLLGGNIAFGLGVFGPAGVGHYSFADPEKLIAEGNGTADVNALTGQRYTLIETTTTIFYPTFSIAARVAPGWAVGVSLQNATMLLKNRQALAASSAGGTETIDLDAIVGLDVSNGFSPTGVLGIAGQPLEQLRVAATFRPPIAIHAEGTIDVKLPAAAAGFEVIGNTTQLDIKLPPLVRLGGGWFEKRWNASAELVWEGWSYNDKFVLTPDVTIKPPGAAATKLAKVDLIKEWQDTIGARLGGSFDVIPQENGGIGATIHAGALYESNAVPSKRQAIDYVGGNRLGFGGGVTGKYGPFQLTISGMAYAPVKITVEDSLNARTGAEPDNPPIIVGNGEYRSNIWIAAIGLAYAGGTETPK